MLPVNSSAHTIFFQSVRRRRRPRRTAPAPLKTPTANALSLARFMIGIAAATAGPVRFPPTTTRIHKEGAQDMRQDKAKVIAASAAIQVTIVRLTANGMITCAIASTTIPVPAVAVFQLTPLAPTPLSVVPALRVIKRRRDVCRRQLQRPAQAVVVEAGAAIALRKTVAARRVSVVPLRLGVPHAAGVNLLTGVRS
jgi:hypothetical protein